MLVKIHFPGFAIFCGLCKREENTVILLYSRTSFESGGLSESGSPRNMSVSRMQLPAMQSVSHLTRASAQSSPESFEGVFLFWASALSEKTVRTSMRRDCGIGSLEVKSRCIFAQFGLAG